jgi:hypothetical protein
MEISPAKTEKFLAQLAETPRQLAALSRGLDSARLNARTVDEPWSANDILAHLRACADVWGKGITAMLTQEHPTLRYVSPRTWIRKKDYPTQEFHASLQAFTAQREQLVAALKPLPLKDWSRGATFTATTRGREQTVFSYVQRMAEHERGHCEQIEALLHRV